MHWIAFARPHPLLSHPSNTFICFTDGQTTGIASALVRSCFLLVSDKCYPNLFMSSIFADKDLNEDLEKRKIFGKQCALTTFCVFACYVFAFNTNLCYWGRPLIIMAFQKATGTNVTFRTPYSV